MKVWKQYENTPHINKLRQTKLNGKLSCTFDCGCCSIENTKVNKLSKLRLKEGLKELYLQ